jgi:hypothetical protein
MSPRSRFTQVQINHVLKLYSTVSTTAAYDAGKAYGMKPSRVRQFAFKRGIRAKMGDNCRWKPTRDIHNDTRWARAIAIGPVLA